MKKLDPTVFTDVFNDILLKKYVTQLFKRQWGANLIKFNQVQMLGGTTLNGRSYIPTSARRNKQDRRRNQILI